MKGREPFVVCVVEMSGEVTPKCVPEYAKEEREKKAGEETDREEKVRRRTWRKKAEKGKPRKRRGNGKPRRRREKETKSKNRRQRARGRRRKKRKSEPEK